MIARGLIFLLIALLAGDCGSQPAAAPRSVPPAPFSILSYNIDAYHGTPRETIDAILAADADVVCLQEVSNEWEFSLREALRAKYPQRQFIATDVSPRGLAVLSRFPIRSIQRLDPPADGWFPACVALVDTPAGSLQIVNVHLRPLVSDDGSKIKGFFTAQAVHVREVQSLIERIGDRVPAVIVGDFNEGNDGQATRWLAQNGFTDALPPFDQTTPTWRGAIYRGIEATYRDDHVILPKSLACTDARVLQTGKSDHFPVRATIAPAK